MYVFVVWFNLMKALILAVMKHFGHRDERIT